VYKIERINVVIKKFLTNSIKIDRRKSCVATPHHFDAALAPGRQNNTAPASAPMSIQYEIHLNI
jgi:hypothetical protein